MKSIVKYVGLSRYRTWPKKKPVTILSIVVVSIMLGYLFFLSCLLGFLVCKYTSGKTIGERGKVRSIVIPFRRWNIHLHHWLCAGCLLVFCGITSAHLWTPVITYGFLVGFVFQGIYYYSDWHRIVIGRHKTKSTAVKRTRIVQNGPAEFTMSGDDASQVTSRIEGLKSAVTLFQGATSLGFKPAERNIDTPESLISHNLPSA